MRYLTEDLPGIGGRIKDRPEDFAVEELPLYAPSGDGDHTFFEIRKVGLSTFQAVREIARALGVAPERIGCAGLKDAQAITSQVLSVERVPPERVSTLNVPGVQVQWALRNRQKLKIGHLRGNRFTIRVRGVRPGALAACHAILDVLSRRGVPNGYGPQRFGMRGNSARLGHAVVQRDAEGFIKAFLGGPLTGESPRVQEARTLFDAGDWMAALRPLPAAMADEQQALRTLIQSQGDYLRAYGAVPRRLKTFLVSAYQSELFNRVLDARLHTLDEVRVGDLAMKHPGHSVFCVEDQALEQPRANRFEISPTGPVFGYRMTQASGWPGEMEAAVLAEEGLKLEDFRVGDGIRLRGERRALRFPVHEPGLWDEDGLVLRFWLPAGCYATAVLAEIMKTPAPSEPAPDASDGTEL